MKPSHFSSRSAAIRQTPAERAEWRYRLSSSRFTTALFASVVVLGADAARAQRPLGVDVSSYQGSITWSSVKSDGVTFAWAKATEGTDVIDGDFVGNENN